MHYSDEGDIAECTRIGNPLDRLLFCALGCPRPRSVMAFFSDEERLLTNLVVRLSVFFFSLSFSSMSKRLSRSRTSDSSQGLRFDHLMELWTSDVPGPAQSRKPGQAGPVWAGPSRAVNAAL